MILNQSMFQQWQQRTFILVFSLAYFAALAQADSAVYVVTGGQQFGIIDLATGGFTQVGPNTPEAGDGLAPGPNGSLLTLTVSGNLDSINPATGLVTQIGATGLGDCTLPSSPCGPNTADTLAGFGGKLYATDVSNNLYSVNSSTGKATLIGPTGIPPLPLKLQATNPDGSFNAIDETLFGARGKLYATFDATQINLSPFTVTPVVPPDLWEIDPTTGHATLVAPTTLTLGTAADVNGTVYAFENMTGQVLQLDVSNGQTTAVTNYDSSVSRHHRIISGPGAGYARNRRLGIECVCASEASTLRHGLTGREGGPRFDSSRCCPINATGFPPRGLPMPRGSAPVRAAIPGNESAS